MFEVSFDQLQDRNEPFRPAGLDCLRICTYHVNNVDPQCRPESSLSLSCHGPRRLPSAGRHLRWRRKRSSILLPSEAATRELNASPKDSSVNTTFQVIVASYVAQFIHGPGDPTLPESGRRRDCIPPET